MDMGAMAGTVEIRPSLSLPRKTKKAVGKWLVNGRLSRRERGRLERAARVGITGNLIRSVWKFV